MRKFSTFWKVLYRNCALIARKTWRCDWKEILCLQISSIRFLKHAMKILTTKIITFRTYFIWKRKIYKSNGFFLQNMPSTKFTTKLKGFTHRIQLAKKQYHVICIFRDFWTFWVEPKDPRMTQKWRKQQMIPILTFYAILLSIVW